MRTDSIMRYYNVILSAASDIPIFISKFSKDLTPCPSDGLLGVGKFYVGSRGMIFGAIIVPLLLL